MSLLHSVTEQGRHRTLWRLSSFSDGFTLVELVVVLVLLSVLGAVGMPRFFNQQTFIEWGFTDEVTAALRYAHKLAIASGCDTAVIMASGSYELKQRATCDGGNFTQAVLLPGGSSSGYTGIVPSGITLSGIDLYFDASGRPWDRASGAALSSLTTVSVGSRSIAVEPETGYVHLL